MPKVETDTNDQRFVICPGCGSKHYLSGFYDSDCEKCEQPFNCFGQALRRDYLSNPNDYDQDY